MHCFIYLYYIYIMYIDRYYIFTIYMQIYTDIKIYGLVWWLTPQSIYNTGDPSFICREDSL